jgi:hypothetical protein
MSDLLVKLYELPERDPLLKKLSDDRICIRRAIAPEKHVVIDWVLKNFSMGWASECESAFANKPITCYIAVKDKKMVGFACYEATYKNFFGPTGVIESSRGKGIGKALFLTSMYAMESQGYAYAIIGSAGPKDFYVKTARAIEIEGSVPGIYKGMLE